MESVLIESKKDVNILEGYFTTSEALEIVNKLIDVKINHHKLQILSMRIQNENAVTELHDNRIAELEEEKRKLTNQIRQAGQQGKQVEMNGSIQISFV